LGVGNDGKGTPPMPRFYFDFQSGDYFAKDRVGTSLPDLPAAQGEAVVAAAEWIKDHASTSGTGLRVIVRSSSSTTVFVVNASIKVDPPEDIPGIVSL
jgi:hypothetical protein